MADTKLSEAALAKLLGKTTPLPGGGKQVSPQFVPKPPSQPASSPQADFRGVLNPGAVLSDQEANAEQGMKRGGKVKKHASGGKVRGDGAAIRGRTKGKYV